MKKLYLKLLVVAAAAVVAQSLRAGPPAGYLEMLRQKPAVRAAAKAPDKKPAEKAPVAAAAVTPAPKARLVTSGPPKNATTHFVHPVNHPMDHSPRMGD